MKLLPLALVIVLGAAACGSAVLTLLAAGSGASPARFAALAREHDEAAT